MKTNILILLLQIAGLLHVGLIAAGLLMPRVVSLRENLAELPGFIRRLYWVYYAFIGLCLAGFGSISFAVAPGYTYQVQRATNLNGPWTNVGTLVGPETGVSVFIDTNSPTSQSFYRTVAP
jgi:hypothetical protein